MAKYALIINGDTEDRHLRNVDQCLTNKFEAEGYETYVASSKVPTAQHDHYVKPTLENIRGFVDKLKIQISPQDELVIYTTGHGDKSGEAGTLCFDGGCDNQVISSFLDQIPHGYRVVIMDQCYSGNWNKFFLKNPKTLFIAAGSKDEIVCCQEMAPKFWENFGQIPDLNRDGAISWQERYAHAVAGIISSEPQYVPSFAYLPVEQGSFATQVVEVGEELGSKLSVLQPGQYAIITFSATWCKPCQQYKPQFDQMAAQGGGQHLWLRTEDADLAEAWGVKNYPTVMVVDARGRRRVVEDRALVLEELSRFEYTVEERLPAKIEAAGNIVSETERAEFLIEIATTLAKSSSKDRFPSSFEKLIVATKTIKDSEITWLLLYHIARQLAKADLKEGALPAFEGLILATKSIKGFNGYAYVLEEITRGLAKFGPSEKSLALFEKLIVAVASVEDEMLYVRGLNVLIQGLVESGFKETALPLFNKLILAAEKIEDAQLRAKCLSHIRSQLLRIQLKESITP